MNIKDSPPPIMPKARFDVKTLTPELETAQREAVIEAGMKFVGTPYHQCADIIGAGVDCSMLLVRAWVDAGVFEPFDPRPYPPEWHMHRSEERYLNWMETLATEISEPKRGDIVLFRFGRCFSHGGIFLGNDRILHAFVKDRICSVSELFTPELMWNDYTGKVPRPKKYFDIWAKVRGTV